MFVYEGPELEKEIQGFTLIEDGKSKILYLDLALLRKMGIFSGNYKALSFGEDTRATPFNEVKVDVLDVAEIERKLNQVVQPQEDTAVKRRPALKVVRPRPGTTTINSKKPVRISLSPGSKSGPVASGLIRPSLHSPLSARDSSSRPSQQAPLSGEESSPNGSDNSLETLAALKIARRKSLNI